MKAKYTLKNTTKGWKYVKPETKDERKHMMNKYGERCFLVPKELKYPICDKNDGIYDCRGLRTALFWAQTHHIKTQKNTKKVFEKKTKMGKYSGIFNKGVKLGKRIGCVLQNRKLTKTLKNKSSKNFTKISRKSIKSKV